MTNPDRGTRDVYSFWGRHPLLYAAQDYATFLGRPGRVRGAAVAALGVRSGETVLEVACGTGRNFPYLVRALGPKGVLVGLDASREMLSGARDLCRRKGWTQVELVEGDAAELRVDPRRFDGVLCVLGMSAIPRWQEALRRCHQVLHPGGVLSVCDARLFREPVLSALNPLVRVIYERYAAWDPDRDIPGTMGEIFGNVEAQAFNLGTFVVARSVKG